MSIEASPTGAEGSMFEGLFRARAPDVELSKALRELGVDVTRLSPQYPSLTWAKSLAAVRRAWYPELNEDDGMRRIGVDFATGFQHTIGGKLVLATLPLLNPRMVLLRWPRMVKLGRSDMLYDAAQLGPRAVRLEATDPAGVSPWFSVGILDYLFERLKVTPRVRVEVPSPFSFVLVYEWD